ncbi:seminal vesicle secretory protein 6 [Phodopus roborovskii]|uniref:seminal vesicle secretory protein 6 n=1 Tax=Phodopus roborovskii TaxID=109678 RepID=UPI0021E46D92|nr:seminal vesicle secretory protein 6 [Phodopus roborovskii]
MTPTSFFLLTLLLVLVTEPASGRFREKFSQTSEDQSSETSEIMAAGSSITEEVYEERKYKHTGDSSAGDKSSLSAGELERSYTGRKEKQRFSQEVGK